MGEAELLIAGLLVAVAGLSALACRLSVPYPIVLVVGGALLGFVPGLPEVNLDPEVVLLVFLPLLYARRSLRTSATSGPTYARSPSARLGWCSRRCALSLEPRTH
jgi:NhaP-type Na+/H+ or K+/H+ antiporter